MDACDPARGSFPPLYDRLSHCGRRRPADWQQGTLMVHKVPAVQVPASASCARTLAWLASCRLTLKPARTARAGQTPDVRPAWSPIQAGPTYSSDDGRSPEISQVTSVSSRPPERLAQACMEDFAAVVERHMNARGMSLRAPAARQATPHTLLSKVLNGHKPVTHYLAMKLDRALGTDGEIIAAAR